MKVDLCDRCKRIATGGCTHVATLVKNGPHARTPGPGDGERRMEVCCECSDALRKFLDEGAADGGPGASRRDLAGLGLMRTGADSAGR